jgi:prepilin-type N-terminal cleavage/methylation domain-containing protein
MLKKIKDKKAFTLVELLVVMSILVILTTMMIGILNAIGITNKGRDTQRKKDLARIKIAFEEYFNDKGSFPDPNLVSTLMEKSNCGTDIFKPYLVSWICDPNGNPYSILTETNPQRFRIITNLENKKDKDIPTDWYVRDDFNMPSLGLTTSNANYGVSSSNILWYEGASRYADNCYTNTCFDGNNGCNDHSDSGCIGNCYYQASDGRPGCVAECWVRCCGGGCD